MLPLNNLEMNWKAQHKISLSVTSGICKKRLQEMSSVKENNRIIPAIHKVDNHPVSVTDNILLYSLMVYWILPCIVSELYNFSILLYPLLGSY